LETLAPVLVGALIAIIGGVIVRRLEADQDRRHWVRDQLRMAAEQFLTDAAQHLKVSDVRMSREEGSATVAAMKARNERDEALALDMSRLQLVAPKSVCDKADEVMQKLGEAFIAALYAPDPVSEHTAEQEIKWGEAIAAYRAARAEIKDFAEVVKRHLS